MNSYLNGKIKLLIASPTDTSFDYSLLIIRF